LYVNSSYQIAVQLKAFYSYLSTLKNHVSKMAFNFNYSLLQSGLKIPHYT